MRRTGKVNTLLGMFACSLSLTGCATSERTQPTIVQDVPTTFASPSPAGAVEDQWWKRFGDTRLNALVDKAVADNPSLPVSASRCLVLVRQIISPPLRLKITNSPPMSAGKLIFGGNYRPSRQQRAPSFWLAKTICAACAKRLPLRQCDPILPSSKHSNKSACRKILSKPTLKQHGKLATVSNMANPRPMTVFSPRPICDLPKPISNSANRILNAPPASWIFLPAIIPTARLMSHPHCPPFRRRAIFPAKHRTDRTGRHVQYVACQHLRPGVLHLVDCRAIVAAGVSGWPIASTGGIERRRT